MRTLHVHGIYARSLAVLLTLSSWTFAGNTPPPKMSKETREQIIHAFNEELVYIRTSFPMGKTGLKLKNGSLSPNGVELQQLMAMWGPAVKPGDRVRISSIFIKDNYIRFEINGGPIKKQKWYQRIEVGGTGPTAPVTQPDPSSANARGSFVDLCFDKYVPEMTGPELKQLLRPVFDFDAKSALDAYLETVSPKVKDAITNHKVLVGMNHEMVIFAKGTCWTVTSWPSQSLRNISAIQPLRVIMFPISVISTPTMFGGDDLRPSGRTVWASRRPAGPSFSVVGPGESSNLDIRVLGLPCDRVFGVYPQGIGMHRHQTRKLPTRIFAQ